MSNEVILFDSKNKPIDWFDPVEKVIETKEGIDIYHNNNNIYNVKKEFYHHYTINEIQE